MSKDNIKSTAITYKGYDYQTLFGVSDPSQNNGQHFPLKIT